MKRRLARFKLGKILVISSLLSICVASVAVVECRAQIVPAADRPELYLDLFAGKRLALVVNHTSLVHAGGEGGEVVHLLDHLLSQGLAVNRVFAPEHGFRGSADAGESVGDSVDPATRVPVVSLYGKTKKPSAEQLAGVDLVVFDLQDVGARFYTYISTLHYVMEACAQQGVALVVLDRPNPNGYYVDGPVLQRGYESFVGMHPIPVVYGMTIGELANMINGEGWLAGGIRCDLTVVPCAGYDHTMTYDPPVAPSPNLPNLRAILLYPSLCFFEGTAVSVGRGTEEQFQVIGHPDMASGSYTFMPVARPGAQHPKHEGVRVYGTSLTGLEVDAIMEWRRLNLHWLLAYHQELSGKGPFFNKDRFFDKLAGTASLREQIAGGWTEEQIRMSWKDDLDAFMERRKHYLLYPDFIPD